MKHMNKLVSISQAALILLVSAIVSYSLSVNPLAFLTFFALTALGIWWVVFRNRGPELFTVFAFFVALPAILKQNNVDILYWITERWTIGQDISSAEAIGLGLVIMVGYLALKYLNYSQKEYIAMLANRAEKHEVNQVLLDNQIIIVFILITGVLLTLAVIAITNVFGSTASRLLTSFNGNALAIGLVAVLIIGSYLVWLGIIGKKKE